MAYAQAVNRFLRWCDEKGYHLEDLNPIVVASYIEAHSESNPTIKAATWQPSGSFSVSTLSILTRPINWDLIAKQYDEMVKYATALRLGTADSESILRRFTRENNRHPTYQALLELGKVKRTIFICRYLESESLRQEIHESLKRALTPLIHAHVNPYGSFELDMAKRLSFEQDVAVVA
jgi:hypothetical protein